MAILQFSTAVRNAVLDQWESTIGTSPIMKIYSGTIPANVAASITGTILATLALPSDWMAAASGGTKAKSGTWEDASADASGTASHWRIFAADGTTPHTQGDAGVSGSGASLILDSTSFTAGQSFSVTTFTLTGPGA